VIPFGWREKSWVYAHAARIVFTSPGISSRTIRPVTICRAARMRHRFVPPARRSRRPDSRSPGEDVAFPVDGDSDHDVDGFVADLPIADLHHDRVDEDHRIHRAVPSDRCESSWSLLSCPSSHGLVRCLVGEAEPWTVVELCGDEVELVDSPGVQVGPLGQVLA
jgi:hypothetical protein